MTPQAAGTAMRVDTMKAAGTAMRGDKIKAASLAMKCDTVKAAGTSPPRPNHRRWVKIKFDGISNA